MQSRSSTDAVQAHSRNKTLATLADPELCGRLSDLNRFCSQTMLRGNGSRYLRLSQSAQAALIAATRDSKPVRGLTHDFSQISGPLLARLRARGHRDIHAAWRPGPRSPCRRRHHAGRSARRRREAIGVDISSLAEFVATVKSTVFAEAELDTLERVGEAVADCHRHPQTVGPIHRLRGAWLLQASRSSLALAAAQGDRARRSAARSARHAAARSLRPLRRAAHRAMGARWPEQAADDRRIPDCLAATATEMVAGRARAARRRARPTAAPTITVMNRSAAGLEDDERLHGLAARRGWSSRRRRIPACTCCITAGRSTAARKRRCRS